MKNHDLDFSPEELAALRGMSDEAMIEAAGRDPDAQPMTDEMLANVQPGRRVKKGGDARSVAAKRLAEKCDAASDPAMRM